ncbi:MAG: hypothetical protein V1877_00240 [Candidatus Tagabacteria bacterium]
MAKILIQDIIPAKKQIPKRIERPEEEKKSSFMKALEEKMQREEKPKIKTAFNLPRLKFPAFKFPRPALKLKLVLGIIALGFLILGADILLNKFSSIDVEVTPRQEFAEADASFSASVEPKNNGLPLEVMKMSYSEKETIQPTGKKQVSRKAAGQIIIYNAYSSQPQNLIRDTRFETSDGKIYRIDKSVVVPGAKIEGGKITPSEIEVTVFADKPGEEYNIGLTDFTIPGFKDQERREKIYGRSKTKMEGGLVGEISVATEDDINKVKSSLREKVKNYLLKMGANPKTDNFFLYDEAKQIVFDEQKNGPKPGDETGQLEFEESATFFGFLLKKSDLYRALAEKYLSSEDASQIEIADADKLAFETKNFTSNSINFNIKGQVHFFWKIDEVDLKNELVKERENPNNVFIKYPSIKKAKIVFKPSWWHHMPKDSSQIKITPILIGAPLNPLDISRP